MWTGVRNAGGWPTKKGFGRVSLDRAVMNQGKIASLCQERVSVQDTIPVRERQVDLITPLRPKMSFYQPVYSLKVWWSTHASVHLRERWSIGPPKHQATQSMADGSIYMWLKLKNRRIRTCNKRLFFHVWSLCSEQERVQVLQPPTPSAISLDTYPMISLSFPTPRCSAMGRCCSLRWSFAWCWSLIRWGCLEIPVVCCCRWSPRAPPGVAVGRGAPARGNPSGESRPRHSYAQSRAEPPTALQREQEVNESSSKT